MAKQGDNEVEVFDNVQRDAREHAGSRAEYRLAARNIQRISRKVARKQRGDAYGY